MSKTKTMIISGSTNSPMYQTKCKECQQRLVVAKTDKHCGVCGSKLDGKPPLRVRVKADVEEKIQEEMEPRLECQECETPIVTDSERDDALLAATLYCPVCGSAEVDVVDSIENPENPEADKEEAAEELEASEEEALEEDAPAEDEDTMETKEEADAEDAEDVEDEVQEKLDNMSVEDMEAAFLSRPEGQWLFCANGNPIFRLRQSRQPKEALGIFGSEKFFNIFQARAKETSLFSAAREFGAEFFDEADVMDSDDIEETVYERLQSNVLPKFLDCVAMAIEGMTRNIYPDLSAELKAAFYDELKARGVNKPDTVVDASFEAAGSKVFAAIIAKAMEFYNKPEEIRAELKDTIMQTEQAKEAKEAKSVEKERVNEDDLESQEVAAKLLAGNLPLRDTSEPINTLANASVTAMRQKLSLGKR